MGTIYLITSASLFVLEIILQFCVIADHSKTAEGLFVALLTLVMAPLILINFISAIEVTKNQDFSGKIVGRIICIIFHAFQLGLVWRSLKLIILFEAKDLDHYLKMRLFHCSFHSLPFAILLTYSMFVKDSTVALHIVTAVICLISAAFALTTFQTGSKLYDAGDFENKKERIRKHIGLVFLFIGSFLLLLSRCSSVVLFSHAEVYWIPLPIGVHFCAIFIFRLVKMRCSDDQLLFRLASAFYMSVVNVFEMVRTEYTGVKCSYVFYYTVVLVENLSFGFYWMLTAQFAEMFKLVAVVMILLSFIIGVIIKFSSSGCIFNVESDILTDAFTNPELKKVEEELAAQNKITIESSELFDKPNVNMQVLNIDIENTMEVSSPVIHKKQPSIDKKSNRSKQGSSSASSSVKRRDYHNPAFVHSQGNISSTSNLTNTASKHSQDSQKRSKGSSGKRSRLKNDETGIGTVPPLQAPNNNIVSVIATKPPRPVYTNRHKDKQCSESDQATVSDGHIRRSMIRVSDTSMHASPQMTPLPGVKHQHSVNNLDMASSNSRYSRNTHTLQSSVRNYGYNGFEDPYRERRGSKAVKRNKRNGRNDRTPKNGINKYDLGSVYSNLDYSLDSSELYPSLTSDTSSMSSYSNTMDYKRNRPHHKKYSKDRRRETYDGYITDVSCSEDLSFTDYSADDSCSCSESSDSDGALTWPPSHTSNLADMYNIPDKVSSTDNIMHWLDTMASEVSANESFSTLPDPSLASDTDMSLSALQTFEVKKEHKRFRKLLPKPKDVFLKFRSLNYKDKDKKKQVQDRQFPLKPTDDAHIPGQPDSNPVKSGRVALPSMPLPVDSVQESIV